LENGTAEIEIAASLDPNDSLTRSYLGKAYYEQRRGKLAETEYHLAQQFDPKDPTPWFYDAIKKQTENRPVEALEDMQKAIALNDNRAVYRSKQALDSDLAARSAAQGRIYNDLGFGQRALVEGWKSVNSDPGNYSAHRLLADNYATLPGHELARVSELLQSQLLQPINTTPVQPHLAERNLLIVPGSGPVLRSFNEFNPLFQNNGFRLQASGVVGSLDTYGDEVVHSGIWNDFSYSLGQFHYETNGFRPNNRVDQDIYNAFVQGSLTPDLSVQAEYRHRELNHGLLDYNFDLRNPANIDPAFRRELVSDTYRLGAHYTLSPRSQFIVSGAYRSENESKEQSSHLEFLGLPSTLNFNTPNRGYMVEGQYLYKSPLLDLTVGGGYHENRTHTDVQNEFTAFGFGLARPDAVVSEGNAYMYSYIHAPHQVTWTVGGSLNLYDDPQFSKEFDLLNPKLGVTWNITPATLLRAAAFRTLKRSLLTDQTIEPTQVAGFNQLYDDFNGTKAWRYGLGLDHRFSDHLFAGAEISRRDRDVVNSFAGVDNPPYVADRETLYRAYASWAPMSEVAVNLAYQLEVFDRHTMNIPVEPDTRTHFLPLSVGYFHPSGWLGRVTTTYVNQTVRFLGQPELHDDFVLVDTGIGYRLPGRHGILRFEVNNLFDRQFNYQGATYRLSHSEERMLFYPERTFVAQFTASF
jgi:tetratricopeptide (TPR) repeat protein